LQQVGKIRVDYHYTRMHDQQNIKKLTVLFHDTVVISVAEGILLVTRHITTDITLR